MIMNSVNIVNNRYSNQSLSWWSNLSISGDLLTLRLKKSIDRSCKPNISGHLISIIFSSMISLLISNMSIKNL